MTRCLDCGSSRTVDQCEVCGLTSDAAELVYRRRLVRSMLFFLAGSLLFPYLSQVFAPLDLDAMLVFFGVVFFAALALAIYLDRRARAHKDIEVADVNAAESRKGQTALMWAAAEGHPEVVRVLIDRHADIHAASKNGFTALVFAAWMSA